jgi:hypothetical protein
MRHRAEVGRGKPRLGGKCLSGPDFDASADNYDAVEIGIGTAITF